MSPGQSNNCVAINPLPNNDDCSGQINSRVQKKTHTWGNCVYERDDATDTCVKASENSSGCTEPSDTPTSDDCSWWSWGSDFVRKYI